MLLFEGNLFRQVIHRGDGGLKMEIVFAFGIGVVFTLLLARYQQRVDEENVRVTE